MNVETQLSKCFSFTKQAIYSTSDIPSSLWAQSINDVSSRQQSEADTEAALSLCALGGTTSTSFVDGYTNLHPSVHSKTWVIDVAVYPSPQSAL